MRFACSMFLVYSTSPSETSCSQKSSSKKMAASINELPHKVIPQKETPDPVAAKPALPAERAAILGILGKNTFWLWLDLGALRIGSLLAGFFLIRYLGPHDFVLYTPPTP